MLAQCIFTTTDRVFHMVLGAVLLANRSGILLVYRTPLQYSSHLLRGYLSLAVAGSGNESGVDWRRTEETDQLAVIVNSVDNRRTDSIRIVHGLEGLGAFFVDEPVRVSSAVGVRPNYLLFVIQT